MRSLSQASTGGVSNIVSINNEIWFVAQNGPFRYDRVNNDVIPVAGSTGAMWNVVPINNEIWFAATNGAFRYDPEHNSAIPITGPTLGTITNVELIDNEIWLASTFGVFRYDAAGQISIDLRSAASSITKLLGARFWLASRATIETNYTPKSAKPENIQVIVAGTSRELQEKEKRHQWSSLSEAGYELQPGRSEVHVSLIDSWGNERHDLVLRGWAIPTWSFVSIFIAILAVLFWLSCLALAPYFRPAHLLLMNPYIRGLASFGVVPILLTVAPPVKRHLFRRYRRNMIADPDLRRSSEQYVVPEASFEARTFLRSLADDDRRAVVIHGQSGIGKSAFLRYLAHACADPSACESVPVLIDLSLFGGRPKDAVVSRLERYGELTDERLVKAFLDQGGFLCLFDGVNEVSEESSKEIAQFVDTARERNYACLTTQIPSQEILRVATP